MNSFWVLAGYEYKKLFKRKIVWITVIFCCALSGFLGITQAFGDYYVNGEKVDSHFHMLQTDMAYAKKLSGRQVDEKLIRETQKAYEKIPDVPMYSVTEEYQKYARPYSEISNWIKQMTGSRDIRGLTEAQVYELRRENQEKQWRDSGYTEQEKEFLRKNAEKVETPFTFRYCWGYEKIADGMYTVGILQILLLAICIPGIFSEEYGRKTKPVIAGTILGKKVLYRVKIFVSITFSLGVSVLMGLVLCISAFLLYGTEGAQTPVQYLSAGTPWSLTVGQGVLILLGLFLFTSVLMSGAVAFLAEKTKSSVIPMALMAGYLLAIGMVNIPEQYHIPAMLWDGFPGNLTAVWNAFGDWLYPLGNTYLTAWQAVPIMYLLAGLLFIWAGGRSYKRMER